MSIIDTQTFAIPSDPKEREKIAKVFKDMSNQLLKCESMKEYVKEAKKAIKEEYDIPLSVINRIFNLYHKDNAETYFEEQRETEAFYSILFDDQEETQQ